MASDRVGKSAWVLAVEAGNVIAAPGGSLAVDQALTLNANDRAQARLSVTLLDPVDLVGAPQPTGLDPALALLDRLVIAMTDTRPARVDRFVEETPHALVKRALIAFKPQYTRSDQVCGATCTRGKGIFSVRPICAAVK